MVKEIALGGAKALARKKAAKAAAMQVTSEPGEYLGVRRYDFGHAEEQNEVGLVTGLAWTGDWRRPASDRGGVGARQGWHAADRAVWAT